MNAEEIRSLEIGATALDTNRLLREIAAHMAEGNELRRTAAEASQAMLELHREQFELQNDPARMMQRMLHAAPALGQALGIAMNAADETQQAELDKKLAADFPAPRDPRKRNH